MGRPRKNPLAVTITSEAFDADATIDGRELKQFKREVAFENAVKSYEVVKNLREEMQSGLTHMNYFLPEFKEISKEPSDWVISYFFPIAKDGDGNIVPTYVDAPKTKRQLALCAQKAEIMRKKGLKYLVYREESAIKAEQFMEESGLVEL